MSSVEPQQNYLRKLLFEHYLMIKTKNPSFSLRAYARRIGVSPAGLSEMMNGKRKVTLKTIHRFSEKILLSPLEKEKLLASLKSKAQKNKSTKYLQLDMDQYSLISDWFNFAILSLAEIEDFNQDPAWIAKRLNITLLEATKGIETLERLEMLKRNSIYLH